MFKIPFISKPSLDSLVGKVITLAVSPHFHVKGKVFKTGDNGAAKYEILYSFKDTLDLIDSIGAIPVPEKGLRFICFNSYAASRPPFSLPLVYSNNKKSTYNSGYDERKQFLMNNN